jgi:DEAD/DEAH box helicase domain-containing protein
VDTFSAPTLIHEGAIYLHEGQPYEVMHLDWEGHRAQVRPVQVDYYTDASQSVDIRVLDIFEKSENQNVTGAHGEVLVSAQTTAYKKIKLYSHETLGYGEVHLPQQEMHTTAYWLSFNAPLIEILREQGIWQFEADFSRGPNWDKQRELARRRDGFRCRHCGAPERTGRQHDVHHLLPFREFDYVAGRNDRYLQANELDNLITLCSGCHRLAEAGQAMRSVLAALAQLVRNVAPIFLMCDLHDLGVVSEARASFNRLPTLFVYDRVPSGVGLSPRLYELQSEVLAAALEQVRDCSCEQGCPSCVGPVSVLDQDIKTRTLQTLGHIL